MEFGNQFLPESFWAKVRVREDGCWEWTGNVNRDGYGIYRNMGVHRFMVSLLEEIPAAMVVDHTCHDREICQRDGRSLNAECPHRRCCNPAHLEVVTQRENIRRGAAWLTERQTPYRASPEQLQERERRAALERHIATEAASDALEMELLMAEVDTRIAETKIAKAVLEAARAAEHEHIRELLATPTHGTLASLVVRTGYSRSHLDRIRRGKTSG